MHGFWPLVYNTIVFEDRFQASLLNARVVVGIISSKEIKPYIWISTNYLQQQQKIQTDPILLLERLDKSKCTLILQI